MQHKKTDRKLSLRILCGVLCAAAVMAIMPPQLVSAEAATLTDLNSQYSALEQQKKEAQAKVNEAKTAKEKQQAIKNQLTTEVNVLTGQIGVLNQKIEYFEAEIARQEEKIAALEERINSNNELLKKRLRAMYMTDNSTTLGLIFGSDTFSEALSSSIYIQRIAERDQKLIDQMVADKQEVQAVREEIAAYQEEIENAKSDAEGKRSELNTKVTQTNNEIQTLNSLQKAYEADVAAIQKDMAAVQAEIDAIYAEMAPSGEYVGGSFMYPINGYTRISSYFGWRFNGTDYHTGIDFPAPCNTPIRASNAGTVTFIKTTYTPGRGYGKYLIIDHGGGYSTLYAHCNSIAVKVGQKVKKGETVAYVGTTGWSTGYHLHFEIRVGGVAKNPLNFL